MGHSVCGLSMRLSWPKGSSAHSATYSWPLMAWMSLWVFIPYVLLLSWAGPYLIVGFFFSNPSITLFTMELTLLPRHSIIFVMLLFNLYLPGFFWACCMLSFCSILVVQHYRRASSHAVLCFFGPFHCLRASLVHFILLGILNPFHLLGHHWAIPILHSHGFLLSLLGFLSPNCHILYFRGSWAFPPTLTYLILYFRLLWPIFACFLFLIMPIGLPLLSLSSFGPVCFLWGPFAIF